MDNFSSPIRTGAIICALAHHPSGRGKDIARYYLVISATKENADSVLCLGISRQCPDPAPKNAVLLPFNPELRSRPMTGLRQRCAVFVDWKIIISKQDVINEKIGYVSQNLFNQIMARSKDISAE